MGNSKRFGRTLSEHAAGNRACKTELPQHSDRNDQRGAARARPGGIEAPDVGRLPVTGSRDARHRAPLEVSQDAGRPVRSVTGRDPQTQALHDSAA
jgi:hypothetical protein